MPPTVTNAQVLAAIDALARQQQQRDEPLEAWQSEVSVTLNELGRRMDGLERTVAASTSKETKRDVCPFRDDIVSAANNKGRIKAVEEKTHALEVKLAAGGLLAVAITAVITGGKAAGWW
jgi:hypothetical protein